MWRLRHAGHSIKKGEFSLALLLLINLTQAAVRSSPLREPGQNGKSLKPIPGRSARAVPGAGRFPFLTRFPAHQVSLSRPVSLCFMLLSTLTTRSGRPFTLTQALSFTGFSSKSLAGIRSRSNSFSIAFRRVWKLRKVSSTRAVFSLPLMVATDQSPSLSNRPIW